MPNTENNDLDMSEMPYVQKGSEIGTSQMPSVQKTLKSASLKCPVPSIWGLSEPPKPSATISTVFYEPPNAVTTI